MVLGHLKGRPASDPEPQAAPCWSGARRASAEDVVVVHGRRTAIGRSGRGGFKVRHLGSRARCEMEARGGLGSGSSVRFPSASVVALRPIWDRSAPLREGEALGAGIRTRDPSGRSFGCRTPPPTSFSPPS